MTVTETKHQLLIGFVSSVFVCVLLALAIGLFTKTATSAEIVGEFHAFAVRCNNGSTMEITVDDGGKAALLQMALSGVISKDETLQKLRTNWPTDTADVETAERILSLCLSEDMSI